MAALWSRSITRPESRAAMRALLQRLGNELTTPAADLAGVIGVHKHHVPPGACSLGDTEALELSPTSIQNGLVQARFRAGPIRHIGAFLFWVGLGGGRLGHVRDLQVFKNHRAKAVDQGTRCLVVKVAPLVAHPSMRFCQRDRGPFAPMGTALLAVLGRFATV